LIAKLAGEPHLLEVQHSEVGQRVCHVRVLRSQCLLPDAQRTLVERLRPRKVARLCIRTILRATPTKL
jgi:hypothetical protein